MLEGTATLVKDRTGLKVELEVGQCRKKTMDLGDGSKRNICDDRTLSAHSEDMSPSAHNEQPISLHNIKISSKKTFLKSSKSYRLVSTFVRSRHQALTVRPCH